MIYWFLRAVVAFGFCLDLRFIVAVYPPFTYTQRAVTAFSACGRGGRGLRLCFSCYVVHEWRIDLNPKSVGARFVF